MAIEEEKMKPKRRNPIWISLLILSLSVTGCVQSQVAGSGIAADPEKATVKNPVELVNGLSSEISQARTDQLNVLSPNWFKRAEKAYISAQKDLGKGAQIADIRESVDESRTHLKKAQAFAKVSRATIADTIKARNMALAIARHFPEGTRITAPQGGLTLWVELDKKVDGLKVFQEARKKKISIFPGIICSTTGRYRNFIRISCGYPWNDAVEKGIITLSQIIKRMK